MPEYYIIFLLRDLECGTRRPPPGHPIFFDGMILILGIYRLGPNNMILISGIYRLDPIIL